LMLISFTSGVLTAKSFARRNRYSLQRQNAVGLVDREVSDDDVGHGFWRRQRLGGPSPHS